MSDPKSCQGAEKIPFAALPWAVIAEAALSMGEGAIKYGSHNWRSSGGVEAMTYIAAAQRHLIAYILGEDIDPDSGLPHMTKAITSLMVLRDAQINGVCLDNRPPALPDGFIDGLNAEWTTIRHTSNARAESAKPSF